MEPRHWKEGGLCQECEPDCSELCKDRIEELKSKYYFDPVKKLLGEDAEIEVAELTAKEVAKLKKHSERPRGPGNCLSCLTCQSHECDKNGKRCHNLIGGLQFSLDEGEDFSGPLRDGRCRECIVSPNCSEMCEERMKEIPTEAFEYSCLVEDLILAREPLIWNEGIRASQHTKLIKKLKKEAKSKSWYSDWNRLLLEIWLHKY